MRLVCLETILQSTNYTTTILNIMLVVALNTLSAMDVCGRPKKK